ncbi:MAG: GAF domain-containing protein [Spirochaetia bacterium]|nr:GAF domain-containing protein [Spirochaetia bacterium]
MALRILNLEDNPNDTELTLAELSREWPDAGINRVETRKEFEEALQNTNIDLILADYNLPDFDGLSALEIARQRYPEIPFVFLTGAMGEESAIETLKKGATDFVIKGRLFRLIPAIRRALAEAEKHKKQKETEKKIKLEMEITHHLLMIAESTSQITDIDKLLKQIVSCGHEIMKYDYSLIYLLHKESGDFNPTEQYGLTPDMAAKFFEDNLNNIANCLRDCIDRKEPLIMNCPELSLVASRVFANPEELKTSIVFHLVSRSETLGMLVAFFKENKEFSERDKKIMLGVAHQTSLALHQARLYQDSLKRATELSTRVQTIQIMNEIDKSILSSLDAGEILETVTRLISNLIPCDRAIVAFVDRAKKVFVHAAGFGVNFMSKGTLIPFANTNATEIIETGKAQYITNLADEPHRLPLEENLFQEGYRSHTRVPLYIKNKIAAILIIGSKSPSAFTPEDLSIIEKLSAQVGVALQNSSLLTDLEELFLGIIKSLSAAIDAKSHWTAGHSANVTRYALLAGQKMSLEKEDLKHLEIGSLLHDIGKLGTYEAILDKPGKLSREEYDIVKQHPEKGAEILSPILQLRDVIPAIKHHHEFFNGQGYPDGLKGNEIPLIARIVCIADSIDAMSCDRPYRKAISKNEIIQELKQQSGFQFDPDIAKIFLEFYKEL